jgi:predicted pyridoxine 5'-phosphate oxidase superfamily flavin-nucleotide-binding protein
VKKMDGKLKGLIENNALALATISEDNTPHCIAVASVKVVDKDRILISDNYMSETIKNVLRQNAVTLAVWNKEWEDDCTGFELKGTAEYFTAGKWYDFMRELPENKGMPRKGALLITIKKQKRLA